MRARRFALLCPKTPCGARQNPGRVYADSTPPIPVAGRGRGFARGLAAPGERPGLAVPLHHHGGAGAGRRGDGHQCAAGRRGHARSARPARGHRERHRRRGLGRHRPDRPRRARRLQHPLRRQRHARAQSRGAHPQLRRGERFRADRADRQHAVAVRREERSAGEGPARAGRLAEGQSRQGDVRHRGRRQPVAHRRRAVPERHRHHGSSSFLTAARRR